MFYPKNNTKGFTLIELLVVIAVISLLASVVLASVNSARAKARDAQRITSLKQIQTALELFFANNGRYPTHITDIYYYSATPYYSTPAAGGPGCGYSGNGVAPGGSWCKLEQVLAPYIPALPREERDNVNSRYVYKKPNGFNIYGLRIMLEGPSSASKNDGGYSDNWFELGDLPSYCMAKYSGSAADWTNWDYNNACVGGN